MNTEQRTTVQLAADLLADFRDALTGTGKLTGQSIHLGTNKRYTTLARDVETKLRKLLAEEMR